MDTVSLGILAGGRGQRVGGRDKGLLIVDGLTLVNRLVISSDIPKSQTIVNCPRNYWCYAPYAAKTVCDRYPHEGPVAGLLSLISACDTELIAIAPCDHARPPHQWVAQLYSELKQGRAGVFATSEGRHTPFCLLRTAVVDELSDWFSNGGRSLQRCYTQLGLTSIAITDLSRDIDTPEDISAINDYPG